jgi:DHA1 family inner membrane transport protein
MVMISGLLPDLAAGLSVSVPAVGWLISGYALVSVADRPATPVPGQYSFLMTK